MQSPQPKGEVQGSGFVERSSIYIELAGTGYFYSINLDQLITNHIVLRGGLGYVPISGVGSYLTIPLTGSYLLCSDGPPFASSKFELGAGVTLLHLAGVTVRDLAFSAFQDLKPMPAYFSDTASSPLMVVCSFV
jgi:hypothetical protein